MITANQRFEKDPDTLTYFTVDWGPDLRPGESLQGTPSWSVPDGLTKSSELVSGNIATLWVSGGTVGQSYACRCRATYDSGRSEDWTIYIVVKES